MTLEESPLDHSGSFKTNPSPPPNSNGDVDGGGGGGGDGKTFASTSAAKSTDTSSLEIAGSSIGSEEESVAMLQKGKGAGDDNFNDKIGKDDDDDSTDELSATLTANTYSIIFVADPKSLAFFFGIVFFVFQVSLAALALVDLLDTSSKNNVIKLPAGIPTYVRVAGYLSVVLAVPLFTDLLDSVERIHEGYDKVVLQQAPHATKCKFIMAYSFQFVSGALFQTLIFLLIVQSETVISMLLNFAALQFITEIDDVAFSLAERGYFSHSIKQTCHVVEELKTPNTKGPWLRRIVFWLVIVAVLAGYTAVAVKQQQGELLCNRIEVQFGDGILSDLPLFSGVFYVDKGKRENDRYVYFDEVSESTIFRYCRSEGAWVFGYFSYENYTEEDDYYDEICKENGWLSKSPSTKSFSILDVKPSDWFTTTDEINALVYPVDHLVIRCLDCEPTTCNELGGTCVDDFNLSADQVCGCYEGFFGNECQFDINTTVCDSITFDHRFEPFEAFGFNYGRRYELVVDEDGNFMDFFGKTVYAYTYPPENEDSFGFMEVIAYYGRRFYLTSVDWKERLPNATVETAAQVYVEELRANRQDGFALGGSDYPDFVSDPLDLATGQDKLAPTNLNWYFTATDSFGQPLSLGPSVSTRLVCEQCTPDAYPCLFGQCVTENPKDLFGTCQCDEGYAGPLCEHYDPDAFNSSG